MLAEFPTDIAAFAAMYLVGVCEVERNKPDKAVAAWQRVLHEPHLDPSANEWQVSLFALGRIQFEIALTMKPEPAAEGAAATGPTQELRPRSPAAYERLDDAINRLEEFVARFPNRLECPEARYLLAKALRERAVLPRVKLKKAETDNARKELQTEIQRQLNEAENQLELLIESLQAKESAGLLDLLGQRMLRDAYFERAHNLYAMDKFERATRPTRARRIAMPKTPTSCWPTSKWPIATTAWANRSTPAALPSRRCSSTKTCRKRSSRRTRP